ncbi:hypothetical protein [Caulobacter sp. UNC279MFTsu5.1]|uniref:hypothetical protein n=1 Tax=Caulobacter sp. UNC279MFTsu5.1 TaxID=1502775 RepID=UPI0003A32DAF|nr:hypothetical protein [Caulobacter sp. UNC279MFTsu5.1]SFK41628.1 hypothetical protein SAMN02799626_04235 [Caulobacter sp. UNC279MFTsu5.1]
MASVRLQVLDRVQALVETALPNADFQRNEPKPEDLAPGGVVNMRDGDPGQPDILMSPLTKTYNHRISLELAPPAGADPVVWLDAANTALRNAVRADRTLGGLAEWLEAEEPVTDDVDQLGAPGVVWAEIGLIAVYTTLD